MTIPILTETEDSLKRRARKPAPHYTTVLLPGLAVGSGLLLTTALPGLFGADGLIDIIKCALIGITATMTAFGVNRLSLEKGASQAATGMKGAAALSVCTILTVGGGFFTATYSGFTASDVDRLRLADYGKAQAAYVEAQRDAAMEAARVLPATRSIAAEFASIAACERAESCLSGRGSGGAGPTARALSIEAERASALRTALDEAADRTTGSFVEIGTLQGSYQDILSDESLSAEEKRLTARTAAVQIGKVLTEVTRDDPRAQVAAYAEDLAWPSGAPPEVERLRQSRAAQLRAVANIAPREDVERPAFPVETGVSDTLAWMGHFLPIAMIVAVVELVFPITLWFYAYFALRARVDEAEDEEETPAPKKARAEGGFRRV